MAGEAEVIWCFSLYVCVRVRMCAVCVCIYIDAIEIYEEEVAVTVTRRMTRITRMWWR